MDAERAMQEGARIPVEGGRARLTLDAASYTTLIAERRGSMPFARHLGRQSTSEADRTETSFHSSSNPSHQRTMHRTARIQRVVALAIALALVATPALLRAQAPDTRTPLGSMVFPGDSGARRTTSSGAMQRAIVDTVTAMHARLEMHETTIQGGQAPHAAHRHLHEEMFVVRTGTLEVLLGDRTLLAGPGSVVFCASNELHGIRNAGTEPATYIVMRLDTPASVALAKAAAAARAKP